MPEFSPETSDDTVLKVVDLFWMYVLGMYIFIPIVLLFHCTPQSTP